MAGASGSTIGAAVIEDQYFESETERILNEINRNYLSKIQSWMLLANKYYAQNSKLNNINSSNYFTLKGVNQDGSISNLSFNNLFQKSFRSNVSSIHQSGRTLLKFRKEIADENEAQILNKKTHRYSRARTIQNLKDIAGIELIKSGYRILSEIGEMVRKDSVRYIVLIKGDSIGLNKTIDYVLNLSLDEFLKYTVSSGGKIGVDLNQSQKDYLAANVNSLKMADSFDINLDLEFYYLNVKNHIELIGKSKKFDTQAEGAKIEKYYKTLQQEKRPFNQGHIFEALLALSDSVSAYNVNGRAYKGNKAFWQGVEASASAAASLLESIINTLKDPSAFFHGAEAKEGFLSQYQAKATNAVLTSINTITAEMNRLYTILLPWVNKMKNKFSQLEASQSYPTDDEVVEKLQQMFNRDSKTMELTIYL